MTGQFIQSFPILFASEEHLLPWQLTQNISAILIRRMKGLDDGYDIENGVAVHKTALVEKGAVLKAPVIIEAGCFVAANACLRGGVFLSHSVKIGTGCEIKASIIFSNSAIAHFNFIGDSIVGSNVNIEAGAVAANHYNERPNKAISVFYNGVMIETGVNKFGALIGDHCKVGANAVLSPGTILAPNSIVKRLALIDQLNDFNSGTH